MRPSTPLLAVLLFLSFACTASAQQQNSSYGFLSLSARNQKFTALIGWETIEERTLTGFKVQQSTNGYDFVTVKEVPASQDTSGNSHSYLVTLPNAGVGRTLLYYRLEIGVNNGRILHSKTFMLRFDAEVTPQLSIHPNIVSSTLPVMIESGHEGAARLQVLDQQGRVMQTAALQLHKGMQQQPLDISTLPRGLYVAVVTAPGIKLQQRFFRQ